MKQKNILFLLVACLAVGGFLTTVAFVSDIFAGANSVIVETVYDPENFINAPENEGGVPFFEEISEPSEELSEEISESLEISEESRSGIDIN